MKERVTSRISRRSVLKRAGAVAGASVLPTRRLFAADKKSIRVLTVADPFYYALAGVTDQFKQETGIDVSIESLAYDQLNARLVSSFVSGQPDADVISVDNIWLGQYLESKWIKPLNDLVKADKDVDIADFIPGVLYSLSLWRGQLGTLPVAPYGMGVMYRKDYIDAAGVKIPGDGSWTWAEYLDTIKKLNGQKFGGAQMIGTVVAGQQPAPIVHMFTQLAASMGARWFKHFPEAPWDFTPTIDSKENVDAIKLFAELYKNSPPEAINYNWFDAGMRFAKGDIGAFYWWSAYFYLCRKDGYMSGKDSVVADKMEIVPIPHSDHPQVGSTGGWSSAFPPTRRRPTRLGHSSNGQPLRKRRRRWPSILSTAINSPILPGARSTRIPTFSRSILTCRVSSSASRPEMGRSAGQARRPIRRLKASTASTSTRC